MNTHSQYPLFGAHPTVRVQWYGPGPNRGLEVLDKVWNTHKRMERTILHGFEQELAHALVHRSKSDHAREGLRAGDWSRVGGAWALHSQAGLQSRSPRISYRDQGDRQN